MGEIKRKPIILDGDPGHDDAIALLLAASYKDKLDIKAITAVGGNTTLDKTSYNYLRIATLFGLEDVPVGAGLENPQIIEYIKGAKFHGESGLDGPELQEPTIKLSDLSAVELMAKVIRESDEKVTVVATGPLSNVAGLLLAHPELKDKIECISIMGGGLEHGNFTAAAEYNIYVDPESAQIVFMSGVPIIMAGLDATEKAVIYPEEWRKVGELDSEVCKTFAGWCDFYFRHHDELGFDGAAMHDPCAVMVLVHPEIFTIKECYVEIDTQGEYTRGATVPDYFGLTGNKANCKCLVGVDRDEFAKLLYEACASFAKEA